MAPKEEQKIEIEKTHKDHLLSFNQAVTLAFSDFLGTALIHVVKSLSPQLDEAALKAVRSWKFKLIEGDPDGPKDYQVEISFRATCTPRS